MVGKVISNKMDKSIVVQVERLVGIGNRLCFAHATGRPGVAMVTSGPAATNIVTPLCDAYLDSIPIVVITGQVAYKAIGTDVD